MAAPGKRGALARGSPSGVIMGAEREIIRRSERAKAGERPVRAAAKREQTGRSFMFVRFVFAAALLAAGVAPGYAQVITHRDVGVRMGLAIAVAALDQCESDGNSVSVAVVDRAGRLRVFLQSDRANPHNIELARRKAYTARTFGRTSAEWAKRTTEMPELAAQRELADVIALRGGVPIKVGNETIGAVGVSGSSSEGDEKCAMAGLAKVADQLK
jgi:uncharacterized protein GlcG (DUF336 family)